MSIAKFLDFQLGKDVTLTKEEMIEGIRFDVEHSGAVYRRYDGKYCRTQWYSPCKIPEEFADDREFMLEAVKLNGALLSNASERLKADRELILIAAQKCSPLNLKIPQEYFSERDFMLKLLAVNGSFLDKYPVFDKELILTAVKNDAQALKYVHYKFFDEFLSKDLTLEIVSVNGRALQYVYGPFKDDEDAVFAAVSQHYRAFEFASARLKNNADFLVKVLYTNPSCLAYAPQEYRENRLLIEKLMDINPYCYRYVKGKLKTDADLAIRAVKENLDLYDFVDLSVKRSKKFITALKSIVPSSEINSEYWQYQFKLLTENT